MITPLDVTRDNDNFYPSSFREEIINDLLGRLNALAPCFIQDDYTYQDGSLPVIILNDSSDEIAFKGEGLTHELSVSVNLIDTKIDAELIKKILLNLKTFKSSFANCVLTGINREFEAGERNVIKTELALKFIYFTNLWSY